VLLKVKAAALNYRDLLVVRGQYNPKMPPAAHSPLRWGRASSRAVGPGVTKVKPGPACRRPVHAGLAGGELTEAEGKTALGGAVDGMLREYAVLPEDGVDCRADHLSDEEAATLPCAGVTAWNRPLRRPACQAGRERPGSGHPVACRCSRCNSHAWPGRG